MAGNTVKSTVTVTQRSKVATTTKARNMLRRTPTPNPFATGVIVDAFGEEAKVDLDELVLVYDDYRSRSIPTRVLPPLPRPFIPTVKEIIDDHRVQSLKEMESFSGLTWCRGEWYSDMVWEMTIEQLEAVTEAWMNANERKVALKAELDEWVPENASKRQEKDEAFSVYSGMLSHFPDSLQADTNIDLETRWRNRVEAANMSHQEKRNEIAALRPEHGIIIHEQKVFNILLEAESQQKDFVKIQKKKKKNKKDPFPSTLQRRLKNAHSQAKSLSDVLFQRCYHMRDLGGTVEDITAALRHIPRSHWPPQLDEELKWFRYVRREMHYESVYKLREAAEGMLHKESDKLKFGMALLSELADTIEEEWEVWGDQLQEAEQTLVGPLIASLRQVANIRGTVKKAGGFKKLKKQQLVQIMTDMTSLVSSVANAMVNGKVQQLLAGEAAQVSAFFADFADYIPVLGLAASAMQTVTFALDAKHNKKLADATSEQIQSMEAYSDQAFLDALFNEKHARVLVVADKSFQAVASSIKSIGAAMELSGAGIVPGYFVKVTGSGLGHLGKLVVWVGKKNKKAEVETMLFEALGGDTKKQKKIFKNHPEYAKMMIVMRAHDGEEAALDFIKLRIQNFDESDLHDPVQRIVLRAKLIEG